MIGKFYITIITRLPPIKFIINSVLSTVEYQRFSSLKDLATNLGFKYTWHREGKFKFKDGVRAHFFNSDTDLSIIRNAYEKDLKNNISDHYPRNKILDNDKIVN